MVVADVGVMHMFGVIMIVADVMLLTPSLLLSCLVIDVVDIVDAVGDVVSSCLYDR